MNELWRILLFIIRPMTRHKLNRPVIVQMLIHVPPPDFGVYINVIVNIYEWNMTYFIIYYYDTSQINFVSMTIWYSLA